MNKSDCQTGCVFKGESHETCYVANTQKATFGHYLAFFGMLALFAIALAYTAKWRADSICTSNGFPDSKVDWNLGSYCFNGHDFIPLEQVQ